MVSKNKDNPNWVWGVLLIALGSIFFLNYLLPGFLAGLTWTVALALGGLAFYGFYKRSNNQWWALIPAWVLWSIAGIIILASIGFIQGEAVATFIMFAIGFPFFYVYMRNRANWWALIPAYTMGVIAAFIFTARWLPWTAIVAYWHFAIAFPFFVVYARDRKHWWALIPGGVMAAIGAAFMIAGLFYLIPVLMILVGVYLVVQQMRGKKVGVAAQQLPLTGPEADRASEPDFEPIGAAVFGPEADRVKE